MLDKIDHEILMNRAIWTGLFSGLYSVTKKNMVPKPTADCLGPWIISDIKSIDYFYDEMLTNFWAVPSSDYEKVWYQIGDLMFKNDDYGHFK